MLMEIPCSMPKRALSADSITPPGPAAARSCAIIGCRPKCTTAYRPASPARSAARYGADAAHGRPAPPTPASPARTPCPPTPARRTGWPRWCRPAPGRSAYGTVSARPESRPSTDCRPRWSPPAGARASATSDVAHFQNFIFARAGRRLHFDHVAGRLADQRAGDRRRHRDLAQFQVRLVEADDLVGHLGARVQVFQVDGGGEHHAAIGVQRGRVDDLRRAQLAFQFGDTAFNKGLALLGGIVLGVLGQVAMRARFSDRVDDDAALFGLQLMQLFFQEFGAVFGKWN